METLKKYNLEEEEEKLFQFLLLMADEQNKFLRIVHAQGYRLDNAHSMDTLEELERYIREQSINFKDPSDAALLARMNCWFYLGEVVKNNFGGNWQFSMNAENTINWGKYVISGHSPVSGVEFEPQGLVRRFIANGCRTGVFRRAILSHVTVDDDANFLSHIPTEKGDEV